MLNGLDLSVAYSAFIPVMMSSIFVLLKPWRLFRAAAAARFISFCVIPAIVICSGLRPWATKNSFTLWARAIDSFFDEGNWELGKTVLRLVKSDILVLEYLNGRRELE